MRGSSYGSKQQLAMDLSISVAMNVVCALLHEQLIGSLVRSQTR